MSIKGEENIAALKKRIREKAAQFHELLNNPVGKQLVDILIEEFVNKDDLRGRTVEDTYYNLGARDVVVYLQQLQRTYAAIEREQSDAD